MQEVASEHVCATRCPVWYSPPLFHPRSLSCIHYFLVDADDDDNGWQRRRRRRRRRRQLRREPSAIPHTGSSSLRSSPCCPTTPCTPFLNYFKPLFRCNMTTQRLWEKKCASRCHRSFVWYRCRKHGADIYSLEESPRKRDTTLFGKNWRCFRQRVFRHLIKNQRQKSDA